MMKRLLLLGTMFAAALSAPASASASDFYVDRETGNNSNDCSTPVLACDTIGRGVTFATNAGAGNRVLVDDSPSAYSENSVTLFSDVDVIADNTVAGTTTESPTGKPIIQTAAAQSQALFVQGGPGSPGTTISGFTFRPNDQTAISVSGAMTSIEDNDFEGPASPTASDDDVGLSIGGSSPTVSGNNFTNLRFGLSIVGNGSPAITGNQFSGIHNGNAVNASIGSPSLTANVFQSPGASAAQAVRIGTPGPTHAVAATFSRNRIDYPASFGVNIGDTAGPISFDGDLITSATIAGIALSDSDNNGDTAVSVTDATIVSGAAATAEISSTDAALTLDSSIIGAKGIAHTGDASCAISFSRGPVTGSGCDNFATTADPLFVNAGAGDFHLQQSSTLIDAGNPAAPPGGAVDLDGDLRALDGNCDGTARRDVGADELVKSCPPPPSPSSPVPPASAPAKKHCKKGQKLKKGKCVKKKRKK